MACFCAAGIAHFCKLPQLPPRRQCPLSFFLQMPRIGPPTLRPLSKTIQPAFAAFCPVSKLHPFFAPYIFPAQISRLAKLHPFLHFSFVCKKQHFLRTAILRAFLAFFIFAPIFQKQEFFCVRQKIRLYFNHTKRGGVHFKPPKQHPKLKFIFLKSTQNLWKGFWENLTMCHILPHFAGKQCAFFN